MQSPGAPDLPGTSSAARLEFELEAVTPLFLGGADPTKPEIRASSFRGALRFWFRALAAESDLACLRQREAAVFGDTSRASAVRVDARLSDARPTATNAWADVRRPRSGRQPSDEQLLGLDYLAFALRGGERRCFSPGTRVSVALAERPGSSGSALLQAGAAFWLLINLGGLGTRSRRGLGGLDIVSFSGAGDLPPFHHQLNCPEDLHDHLSRGLRWGRRLVPAGNQRGASSYALLSSQQAFVLVMKATWPTWQEALGELGHRLKAFRKELFPTLDDLRQAVAGVAVAQRAAFGLPIQYYHPGTKEKYTLAPVNRGDVGDRRASPLYIKVVRLKREYGIVLICFGAAFLPISATLEAGQARFRTPTTVDTVTDFLKTLNKRPGLLRVQIP